MTGCVVIGCDNAAVPMKDILKRSIEEMGIAVEDMGVSSEADQLPYALTDVYKRQRTTMWKPEKSLRTARPRITARLHLERIP